MHEGVSVAGGMRGRGACMVGGVHDRGHAWQGVACMAGVCVWQGGMHGRGHVRWGVCIAGGHVWHTRPLPQHDTTRYGRSIGGRYASYWNAF